jgi:hypothetical protein
MFGRKNRESQEGALEVNVGSETGIERDIPRDNTPVGRILAVGSIGGATTYGLLNQAVNKVAQYGSKSEVLAAVIGVATISGVAAFGVMHYLHRRHEKKNGQGNYSSEQK